MSYWLRWASSVMTMTSERSDSTGIVGLAGRLVEPELVDQREHVAVVGCQQLAQVRDGLGVHLRLGGDRAGVGELAVQLVVELGAVGDHHERPRARARWRSTFWVNHSIDRLLPDPWVCQKTPSRLSPLGPDPVQVLDRGVDAEVLVVAGHDLDQPARALHVGDEVLDQVEQPVAGSQVPRMRGLQRDHAAGAVGVDDLPVAEELPRRVRRPDLGLGRRWSRITKQFGTNSCGIVSR